MLYICKINISLKVEMNIWRAFYLAILVFPHDLFEAVALVMKHVKDQYIISHLRYQCYMQIGKKIFLGLEGIKITERLFNFFSWHVLGQIFTLCNISWVLINQSDQECIELS